MATTNRLASVNRPRRAKGASNSGKSKHPGNGARMTDRKSIEQLAAEQGVAIEGQLDRIMGIGANLWSSDKEFEEFVQGIYDRRRERLSLGKQ